MDNFGEEPLPEDDDAFIDYLIEVGILEEEGLDEDGEITYVYNFEIMKVLMPEMYEEIMDGLNQNLIALFEQDLISVEYDENLVAHISATEEGMEYFRSRYEGNLD